LLIRYQGNPMSFSVIRIVSAIEWTLTGRPSRDALPHQQRAGSSIAGSGMGSTFDVLDLRNSLIPEQIPCSGMGRLLFTVNHGITHSTNSLSIFCKASTLFRKLLRPSLPGLLLLAFEVNDPIASISEMEKTYVWSNHRPIVTEPTNEKRKTALFISPRQFHAFDEPAQNSGNTKELLPPDARTELPAKEIPYRTGRVVKRHQFVRNTDVFQAGMSRVVAAINGTAAWELGRRN
jgi:hypothetical protein